LLFSCTGRRPLFPLLPGTVATKEFAPGNNPRATLCYCIVQDVAAKDFAPGNNHPFFNKHDLVWLHRKAWSPTHLPDLELKTKAASFLQPAAV
jgi:hypothetical protein